MSRQKIGLFLVQGFACLLAAGQAGSTIELHKQREAATDLEVAGLIRGVPPTESRFVSRESLETLPQVETTISVGRDFKTSAKLHVKGIYLDVLAKSLGSDDGAVAIATICNDGYMAPFPSDYIQKHKPLVVIAVDGMTPHDWSLKTHQYDAGPYFVGYERFEPSFHVLAHTDRPQEPDGMTKIVVDTDEGLFASISPKGTKATDGDVMNGFRIASQNCFRCHNAGTYGGTKAGVSWTEVASIARKRSQYFGKWVHDPHAMRSRAEMPANLDYDHATLTALQRYFSTFAVEGQ